MGDVPEQTDKAGSRATKSAEEASIQAARALSAAGVGGAPDVIQKIRPLMTDSLLQQFGTCSLEGDTTRHSAGDIPQGRFVPDLSLIDEKVGRPPRDYPFIAQYDKSGKSLDFFASKHDSNDTFLLTEKAIENGKPDAIIFEGQLSPGGRDEMDRAAALAAERNIKLIGGDETHAQVFQYLRGKGYSAEDFVNQQFTLQIAEWARQHENKDLAAEYNKHAKGVLNDLHQFCSVPESKHLNFQDFEKWYEKNIGKPFSPSDFADRQAPTPDLGGTPLQRMLALENQARNRAMVKAIADAMSKYSRVLVIYGGTHFLQQQRAMEDMFGKPTFEPF